MHIGITIGTNYAGVPDPDELLHVIDRVEELGFDSLWVGDHIAWTNPTLEALTTLAMYAARTKRVTIGTSILILPLRHPVVVAKMLATMAYVTKGRVVAGLAVGGENPSEFQAVGVSPHERGGRMNESLEIMSRLWSESGVSYHGKYFAFDDVTIEPKPPRPIPIWLGGRSEAAYKRAASMAQGWIAAFSSPRHFKEGKAAIEALGARPGFEWVQFEYMHVSADREKSKASALDYLNRTYNMDFGERVERFASFGPGSGIAERLAEFEHLGCTHVIVNPTCTPTNKLEQIEAIAREVLPLVRH